MALLKMSVGCEVADVGGLVTEGTKLNRRDSHTQWVLRKKIGLESTFWGQNVDIYL